MKERFGIGLDIGATRVRVCVGDSGGSLLWKQARTLPVPDDVDDFVKSIVGFVGEARVHVPAGGDISGIGVASVGPLDIRRGMMASPANLPYDSVPLVEPLKDAFSTDVILMNDANAAVLAEKRLGAGKTEDNLVFVTLSTGIGGGAIVDGHLLVGKDGNAAEIGHVVLDPTGALTCGCGRRGHWEAYCSGRNIPRLAELLAAQEEETKGRPLKSLLGLEADHADAAAILGAAAKGNSFGLKVAREVGRLNALGFANVINMFDPSLITVGGSVALNNQQLILGSIRDLAPTLAINSVPRILVTPLGDDAGLLGALSLSFGDRVP